jgi:hypothetical protein
LIVRTMLEDQTDSKIDIFLLCNSVYLRSSLNEGAPLTADDRLITLMQAYIGHSATNEDCRQKIVERKSYYELLAQASSFVVNTLPTRGIPTSRHIVIDPREFVASGDIQFKDLTLLANVTRFILAADGGSLKKPITREDFLIPKEKVLSCYFKFIGLKRNLSVLARKIQKSDQTDFLTEKLDSSTSMDNQTIGSHTMPEVSHKHETAIKQTTTNPDCHDTARPVSISSIQMARLTIKARVLMAEHARFSWAAQIGLFLGKLEMFRINRQRFRSRSCSKPGRKGRSLER